MKKLVTDDLLKDLGFSIQKENPNEFKQLDNVHVLPFTAYRVSQTWSLKVHIDNLIADFGPDAVIDALIRRIK